MEYYTSSQFQKGVHLKVIMLRSIYATARKDMTYILFQYFCIPRNAELWVWPDRSIVSCGFICFWCMVLLEKGEACYLLASAKYYTTWKGQWYLHPLVRVDFQPFPVISSHENSIFEGSKLWKSWLSLMLHNIFLMGKSAD